MDQELPQNEGEGKVLFTPEPVETETVPLEPENPIPQSRKFPVKLLLIAVVILAVGGGVFYFISLKSQRSVKPQPSTPPTQQTNRTTIQTQSSQETSKSEAKTLAIASIGKGEIVYSSNGRLSVFNIGTGVSDLLPVEDLEATEKNTGPSELRFSPNGKYLAFHHNSEYLYLYDYENKKRVTNLKIGANAAVHDFSPDSHYAIIDTGSAPGVRSKTLIDMNGKIITRFGATQVRWLHDSSGYLYATGEVSLDNLALGPSPTNNSIFLVSVADPVGSKRELLKGTYQISYSVESVTGNKFVYEKSEFSEPFPKTYTNEEVNDEEYQKKWLDIFGSPEKSYWEMDIATGVTRQIDLPAEDRKPYEAASYSPDGKWKVVIEGEHPNRRVVITDKDNTEKADIAPGDDAVWRPVTE